MIRSDDAGEPPTPEERERLVRRLSPPDNEIPAGIGLSVLLGRADDVAVGITQVEAFSTGFRFMLAVRVRPTRPHLAPGQLFHLVGSHLPPGVEIPLEDRLLLGIEYADGRRASVMWNMQMPGRTIPAPDQLTIVSHGGGGSERAVDQAYWVTPLPPDGPVTVVMDWSGFGIPESRAILDGAAIRSAAGRSHTLWPPEPASAPPPPPPPPRPSSGWFAEPPA